MAELPGERVLREAGTPGQLHFVLTTHRVRVEQQRLSSGTLHSIMLDEVASCVIARQSNPTFLVLGAMVALFGLYQMAQDATSVGLFIAGIGGGLCVLLYLLTRRMVLEVGSASANVSLNIANTPFEEVKAIVDAIEGAKHARYLSR